MLDAGAAVSKSIEEARPADQQHRHLLGCGINGFALRDGEHCAAIGISRGRVRKVKKKHDAAAVIIASPARASLRLGCKKLGCNVIEALL
jgi:hypothetical protein